MTIPGSAPDYQRWFWWLMAAAATLLFVRLGAAPIYILDEAKNAQCAREMWHHGNWIVPTFNGELRTDKPPLHYWVMALCYELFGVGPAQARLGSAIMGLATLYVVFAFVRRWTNAGTAFFTVLGLVLSVHFMFEFRLSVPDPYLIFFTTAGLMAAFAYLQQRNWKWLLLAAASLGLATLAKGPVALALPGLSLLIYIAITRQWKRIADGRLLLAALLVVAIAAPWYMAVHRATAGAFTQGFFFEHNLSRFSSEMEGHGGFFMVTLLMLVIGMLPFSAVWVEALKRRNGFWTVPIFKFSAVVVLVYLVFFSISSTKLPNYAMPCYPFAAVVAGFYMHRVIAGVSSLPAYVWWVWIVLGMAIAGGAFFGLRAEPAVAHLWWIGFGACILPLGLLWVWFNCRKQALKWLPALAGVWLLFGIFFTLVGYPLIYQQNPIGKINDVIGAGPHQVVAYRQYNPAFNFNNSDDGFVIPVMQHADSLRVYRPAFDADKKLFVLTRLNYLPEIDTSLFTEVARHRDLFELPTSVLLQKK